MKSTVESPRLHLGLFPGFRINCNFSGYLETEKGQGLGTSRGETVYLAKLKKREVIRDY